MRKKELEAKHKELKEIGIEFMCLWDQVYGCVSLHEDEDESCDICDLVEKFKTAISYPKKYRNLKHI